MRALDLKLLRDFGRLWAQSLAIALVVAGGVATVVMAVGAQRSLEETRSAYYERNRFADVFATAERIPRAVVDAAERIPGVAMAEGRISSLALADIPGVSRPATVRVISLPAQNQPRINRLHVRTGRLPDPGSRHEVVVNESFAEAQGFRIGSRFAAILNGVRRDLVVVGTVLSPEFLYAIGPGDIMPDDRRFGIVWMPESTMAGLYDLKGASNSLVATVLRDASLPDVIASIDRLLDRAAGRAAYGREDQTSHAFVDHELDMLRNMSRTLPPIFLLVAAFLVNVTLGRLVALEREQIGLLKALGYANGQVALHYLKLVALITLVGIAIGGLAGTLLGAHVTELFGRYFRFPFLVFSKDPSLYLVAASLSLAAAVLGASRAVRSVLRLSPAVAMQPPAPAVFRRGLPTLLPVGRLLSAPATMPLRHALHHPARSVFTIVGVAFATGILVVSLFTGDTIEELIDVTYFLADRQDATVGFVRTRPEAATRDVARLPGVLAAEPVRSVAVRIRNGSVERRIAITGYRPHADLSRIINVDLRPVDLPEDGLAISALLGRILGVSLGDRVEVDLLEGERRTIGLPVVAFVEDYFGIRGMMDARALARVLREAPSVDAVHVVLDETRKDAFYAALKRTPMAGSLALQRDSLAMFRTTVALFVTTMATIYVSLSAVIAFGIVYNGARIALSERARDLASLRVLGFTRTETTKALLLDLVLLTLLAQPLGWAIGYGLAAIMQVSLAGELMRVRLVVDNATYATASGIVLAASAVSALAVARRVGTFDLVAVLKTRD
jgi:putative ABC transport system permease protein